MMISNRTACALGATAVISSVYLYDKFLGIAKRHETDSFFERLSEIMKARVVRNHIRDTYTAKGHTATIAALSSAKPIGDKIERSKQELYTLQTDYSYYLAHVVKDYIGRKEKSPLVFHCEKNLKIPPFIDPVETFIYSGTLAQLHNLQARIALNEGNYVDCSNRLQDTTEKTHKTDVLLTGTTELDKCQKFKNNLERTALNLAAYEKRVGQTTEEDVPTPQYGSVKKEPSHDPETPMQ